MKTDLYGRGIPGSLDAVNGGCIPLLLLEGRAHLPGISPGQGQVTREALARTMRQD